MRLERNQGGERERERGTFNGGDKKTKMKL